MDESPGADIERLLRYLDGRFGDALRSCVEYTPNSSRIHFLRDDIEVEKPRAEARLVRVEELYHAERLSAAPLVDDSELGRLHVSCHLFDGALVVHLVETSGRVVGVSLDVDAQPELLALSTDLLDALYGDVPDRLDRADRE
jgi:hypothetical protein